MVNLLQLHAAPLPLFEARNFNTWSGVSVVSVVTGLKVVNGGALVLFPASARNFAVLKTMQIGYGAHKAYYSMGERDKAAGA
jgi:hypothetical protein